MKCLSEEDGSQLTLFTIFDCIMENRELLKMIKRKNSEAYSKPSVTKGEYSTDDPALEIDFSIVYQENLMLKKLYRDVSGSLHLLERKHADLAANNRQLRSQLNNQNDHQMILKDVLGQVAQNFGQNGLQTILQAVTQKQTFSSGQICSGITSENHSFHLKKELGKPTASPLSDKKALCEAFSQSANYEKKKHSNQLVKENLRQPIEPFDPYIPVRRKNIVHMFPNHNTLDILDHADLFTEYCYDHSFGKPEAQPKTQQVLGGENF